MLDNMKFGQGGVSPAGFKQLDNCFSQDIADVVLLAQELLESVLEFVIVFVLLRLCAAKYPNVFTNQPAGYY